MCAFEAYSGATSKLLLSLTPFGGFTGGAAVATASVTGDAAAEIVAGQGPGGGAQVSVFDGRTGALDSTFLGATGSGGIAVGAG